MSFLARLALLFVIVPVLELMLLIQIGQWVGLLPTLGLVVFTGATGAYLARAEGMRVLWQFQQELAQGRIPGQPLQDGIAVLVGGAFLLTPGILTDFAGFSLLLPPTRRWIQARVRRGLERSIREGSVRFTVLQGGGFGIPFGGPQAGSTGGAEGGSRGGPFGGAGRRDGLDPDKEIRVERRDDELGP